MACLLAKIPLLIRMKLRDVEGRPEDKETDERQTMPAPSPSAGESVTP